MICDDLLRLCAVTFVTLLGCKAKVAWSIADAGLRLDLPPTLPGEHPWVFRIEWSKP